MATTRQLHDHLKSTGTGENKLELVKLAPTAEAAVNSLKANGFEVTAAKAEAFLAAEKPTQDEPTGGNGKKTVAKGNKDGAGSKDAEKPTQE